MTSARRKLIGWYAYDWASQPYHTLIVTFIFGPYVVTLVGDPAKAQSAWAATLALSGLATGILAPILGAIADESGRLVRWTALLSLLYMACAAVLWFAAPGMSAVWVILFAFGIGLLAVELATTVTNAMLPRLAPRQDIGGVSGTGFALGYLGGLVALLAMLAFFAENDAGKTLLGQPPLLGLDPSQREGTRSVGPFTALWYGVFMIPFFLFLRDPMREGIPPPVRNRLMDAAQHVRRSLRRLPQRPSLASYLASSMLYRDALNGLYAFGGIYATGVLGWSVVHVGIFGILGVTVAGLASWAGGQCDRRMGPKPVITSCILILTATSVLVVSLTPSSLLWIPLAEGSPLPHAAMFLCGAVIGGAGGALQAASRSMMVRHTDPDHPTEAFGLYALSGKATAFVAPLLIGIVTAATSDQRLGVSPLIVLFLLGLALLAWVNKDGDIPEAPPE